jgi:DNA-binding XRE family transcriptional regulator
MAKDEKVNISIEISKDAFEKITNIVHVTNYNLDKGTKRRVSPEDVVKIGLFKYIDLYFDGPVNSNNANALLLGTDRPLKNKIKLYLKKKKLSQVKLSERAGIGTSTLSEILNNKHQPSLDIFLRIYVALGYPELTELLYREHEKTSD